MLQEIAENELIKVGNIYKAPPLKMIDARERDFLILVC